MRSAYFILVAAVLTLAATIESDRGQQSSKQEISTNSTTVEVIWFVANVFGLLTGIAADFIAFRDNHESRHKQNADCDRLDTLIDQLNYLTVQLGSLQEQQQQLMQRPAKTKKQSRHINKPRRNVIKTKRNQ